MRAIFVGVLLVAASSLATLAQAPAGVPRGADGKPDFTGVWQGSSVRPGKWEDANNGLGVGGTGKDPSAPPSLGSQQVITEPAPYQPWAAARVLESYNKRGVFVTTPMDVMTEDTVVFSDQKSAIDIRLTEYPVPPQARDWVFVPAHMSMPEKGPYEIVDVDEFHDGRARLSLRLAVTDETRPG